MLKGGNSLAEFATDVLIQENGEKVDKERLYQVYCKWCSEHNPKLSPDTKEKIGRSLTRFAPYTQASRSGKERYWLNLKINTKYDTCDTLQKNMRNYTEVIKDDINDNKNNIYVFSESDTSVTDKKPIDFTNSGIVGGSKDE